MIGTPWWTSATCIVCGVETENRCSDCAAHGTEWIYFCSIKHKKLVSLAPILSVQEPDPDKAVRDRYILCTSEYAEFAANLSSGPV